MKTFVRTVLAASAAAALLVTAPPGPAAAASATVDNATAGGFTASGAWGTSS